MLSTSIPDVSKISTRPPSSGAVYAVWCGSSPSGSSDNAGTLSHANSRPMPFGNRPSKTWWGIRCNSCTCWNHSGVRTVEHGKRRRHASDPNRSGNLAASTRGKLASFSNGSIGPSSSCWESLVGSNRVLVLLMCSCFYIMWFVFDGMNVPTKHTHRNEKWWFYNVWILSTVRFAWCPSHGALFRTQLSRQSSRALQKNLA